jgi:hypothetical protein
MSGSNGHLNGNGKHPGGRPSKFRPEMVEQTRKLCLLGATDKDLADFFHVEEATINNWKTAHPEFLESLNAAKAELDGKVVRRLFERALGYSHPAVKIAADAKTGASVEVPYIEHYPPDTTAAIFWLKNRQPEKWRDKTEQTQSGSLELTIRYADEASVRMGELMH